MIGRGTSHGCISVINGIVCGTAAVLGIALKTDAVYEEGGTEKKVLIEGTDTDDTLARICVSDALAYIGARETGYTLRISSEIPPSRGLKSSSSVCNAVVKAVLDAHGVAADPIEMIKIGVGSAIKAGVTVTGSFDDACGCELGGFVMTDNYTNTVLKRTPADGYSVVLFVPDETKIRVPREKYEERAGDMKEAIAVCDYDIYKAMTMNGRIVSEITGTSADLIDAALSAGAIAAGVSGTGPAVAAICAKEDARKIAESADCKTVITEMRRWMPYFTEEKPKDV